MTHLKNTTSLANTFNTLFYDAVISSDKAIRLAIKDVVSFSKQVLKAKEAKSLNEFLLLAMPYMIEEEEIKLKNGTTKMKLKLVRKGSFKNYLTWIYNIASNEEILLNDFMKSDNKVSTLSGLNTFINNVKNPKNKEAKNKPQVMASKDVKTSSEVEASKELLDIENLGVEEFKALFEINEVAFNIELAQALESVIKIQLSKVNKEAIKKQA
jgi:hypothetical protein